MLKNKQNKNELNGTAPQMPTPEAYSNSTEVSFTPYDFLMRFGLIDNSRSATGVEQKPVINMRMSPQHAKVLAMILSQNVEMYEKYVGEIVLPQSNEVEE